MANPSRHIVMGPVRCSHCGESGGTLVKVGDVYVHKDRATCEVKLLEKQRVLAMKKAAKRKRKAKAK